MGEQWGKTFISDENGLYLEGTGLKVDQYHVEPILTSLYHSQCFIMQIRRVGSGLELNVERGAVLDSPAGQSRCC